MNELRLKYPLPLLLKVLEISKSSYYYNVKLLDKEDVDTEIKALIKEIFDENKKRYGYRRITLELRNRGHVVNHKRVKRLMKVLGLFGITPKNKTKYKSYKGDMNGTCKNQLLIKNVDEVNHKTTYERDFSTTGCNQKWATDVSEFRISAGKLYLSPIIDMHNNEIVSYDISYSPNYMQITNMLDKALLKYDDLEGLILHSDQGWPYQMKHYHQVLKEKGIIQSMSRKGNCLDNSVMENFFGKMKNEMFYGYEHDFETLEQLKKEMEEYITYYNEKRIMVKLKGLTPLQARAQAL
ncbi:MAG: IS3 family transposase [Bacilli bacterium]|nr:IS3 family transposase [Bacilli bacterium]